MKIALAHDSFTQLGGAERIVDTFHEMFPDAPVFTLVLDRRLKDKYQGWDIRTSWLQVFYNFIPRLQYFLPLIPFAVLSLDFRGYDVVLSSSSGFIKNIRVPKKCRHVNYCHTPTRFLWGDENYVNQEVPVIIRPIVKWLLVQMKKWDHKGSQRVTQFIANSQEVQNRIQAYYECTSTVVYPFVDTEFWKPVQPSPPFKGGVPREAGGGGIEKSDYFLLAGRLQAHKKNELIIEIFNELGLPLHVVGTGRQEKYLQSIAKPNISFLGRISDTELREQYSGALGFLYPQIEDFGLMPLEAAACGTATLAFAQGGALETVVPGETGELFGGNAVTNVVQAPGLPVKQGDALHYNNVKTELKNLILNWHPEKYQQSVLLNQAKKFGKQNFKESINKIIRLIK